MMLKTLGIVSNNAKFVQLKLMLVFIYLIGLYMHDLGGILKTIKIFSHSEIIAVMWGIIIW